MISLSVRSVPGGALAAILLGLAACTDATDPLTPEAGPASEPSFSSQGATPTGASGVRRWSDVSDPDLWAYIARADSSVQVGLKAPGAERGMFKGRILLSHAEWQSAQRAVASHPGVSLLSADTLLPMMRLKIGHQEALVSLRRLAFVDYIEPDRIARDQGFGYSSGCDDPKWNGARNLHTSGDILPDNFVAMRIPAAWQRGAQGQGITVGLVDTGIHANQPELSQAGFATGNSTGRWIKYADSRDDGASYADPVDKCSHGTRLAGVIAAPMNGSSIVGIAWRANLLSVRGDDDVLFGSTYKTQHAIRFAAERSRIINMSFGSTNWWQAVTNEIEYWHYNHDRLFVAAAGTSFCGNTSTGVTFPGSMSVVLTVTGVDYYSAERATCGSHYGPEVDLTAVVGQPATGFNSGDIWSISYSSNSAAIVSGVAALVWSQNPSWSRDQIRVRLLSAGSFHYPNQYLGYGTINAFGATGGFWDLQTEGDVVYRAPGAYTVTAKTYGGTGPFTYEWSNGATTPSTQLIVTQEEYNAQQTASIEVTVIDHSDGMRRSRAHSMYYLPYVEGCPECVQ